MKVYRFVLFTAMLLYSCPDAASTSGNSKLTVHGQDRDSDILTKRFLRGSVSEEADADDDERGITRQAVLSLKKMSFGKPKKNDATPQQDLDSLVADMTKHLHQKIHLNEVTSFFKNSRFQNWYTSVNGGHFSIHSFHYKVLATKIDQEVLAYMILFAHSSRSKSVRKIAKDLETEQFLAWGKVGNVYEAFGKTTSAELSNISRFMWDRYLVMTAQKPPGYRTVYNDKAAIADEAAEAAEAAATAKAAIADEAAEAAEAVVATKAAEAAEAAEAVVAAKATLAAATAKAAEAAKAARVAKVDRAAVADEATETAKAAKAAKAAEAAKAAKAAVTAAAAEAARAAEAAEAAKAAVATEAAKVAKANKAA